MRVLMVLSAVVPLALLARDGAAQGSPARPTMDRQSLSVVPAVHLVVEGVTPEAEADGLSQEALHRDIERMVRQAGITTLRESEWQRLLGNPALHVSLNLVKPSPFLYLYSATVELRQLTILVADSTKAAHAPTWSAGQVLGTTPATNLPSIRGVVRALVERFIEAYEEAGPERPREPRRDRPRGGATRGP